MYAALSAATKLDRRRMRLSFLVSLIFWAAVLPLFSLLRYEGPRVEPSMNPIYVELEAPVPPPARVKSEPAAETVEIADKTSRSAESAAAPAARPDASVRPAPAAAGTASPALRPDPSALPVSPRRAKPAAARGGGEPLAPLSEDALANAAPPAPKSGSLPDQSRSSAPPSANPTASGSGGGRGDAFDKSLRSTSERLAAAPASGVPGGAGSSASGAAKGRADLEGGFDFGEGAKRELLSPRRFKIPDRLLAGLPEVVSTSVSFKIEAGGTVFKSSIRFDPPLPDDLAAFLRTAFSAWQFSFSDSDGQVVFRYSIKVR